MTATMEPAKEKEWVALLGDFFHEGLKVEPIADRFGWSVVVAPDMDELKALSQRGRVRVVLVHTAAFALHEDRNAWGKTLAEVQSAAPEARIIVCHRAAAANAASKLLQHGAYFTLMLPLKAAEVRQALGFVWASRNSPSTLSFRLEPNAHQPERATAEVG